MSTTHVNAETTSAARATADLKLEVVVVPVSDVERSKRFYEGLGWRLDADIELGPGNRVVQLTPLGSPASVQFGSTLTSAAPGSVQNTYLVVSDIEAARDELAARGSDISEVFHREQDGGFASGPAPERNTYGSFARLTDPDGNTWLLQEITTRLPGRVDPATTSFSSAYDLEQALIRAATAHGKHEERNGGERDEQWPAWYAAYMVAEHNGSELPQ
jgi:catechol 2,3-dioxygenase-like lactoylglutathione lyase family enzyme